jgi:hypothetical protein
MGNIVHNPVIAILLVSIVIAIILYRQLRPRKLSQKSLLIFPVIILYFIIQSIPTFHPTTTKLLEIVITSVVSITLGFFACRQLSVYKGATGKAMAKGSWVYFLWWLAAFVIKAILSLLFGETTFSSTNQLEIFLPLFFLILTRNVYLYWKTTKLGLELH